MRRLAAVFNVKRSAKSDAGSEASTAVTADHGSSAGSSKTKSTTTKSRSGLFRGLTKTSVKEADAKGRRHYPMDPLSTLPPDQAASSASSSSGGPTTPSDDHESLGHHNHSRKAWIPFLPERSVVHTEFSPPSQHHQPGPYLPHNFNQEDDASSLSSTEHLDEGPLPPPKPSPSSPALSPVTYFRVITANALAPPFCPPPLLHVPNSPLYPRSCNPSRLLAPSESLSVRMHRKRLLARLDVTTEKAAERALSPFSQRPGVPAKSKRLSLVLDDIAIPKGHRVGPFSQGLRRWSERPCFEDRVIVYLPSEDAEYSVRYERVSSSYAVEALGFSEELELLGALDEVQVQDAVFSPPLASPVPELSLTPSTASSTSIPPTPILTGSTSSLVGTNTKPFPSAMYKAAPSPLRMESTDSSPRFPSPSPRSVSSPVLSIPASLTPGMSPSRTSPALSAPSPVPSSIQSPASSSAPSPKPAVHFAEDDDKDEAIPLDYVMRIKQARDQKAKFLAAERQRRLEEQARGAAAKRAEDDKRALAEERRRLEEARRKHEEERRKQEAERKKLEQERAAWEYERRAAQEEKKQKAIHDELAEARRRRESSRAGPIVKSNEGAVAWEGDREKERERRMQEARGSYSRPRYDDTALPVPKRQSSESNVNINLSASPSSRPGMPFANSSPGSSRPASLAGSQRGSSRPPSMYSTPPSSSSDVRMRRESKASRRTSFISDNFAQQQQQMQQQQQQQMFLQPGTPPGMWMMPPVPPLPMNMNMNMGMMPVAVPVPMMVGYQDMPLLPPAAPFMMQQFGPRGHGQRSHSASPTRGGGSSERGTGSTQGRESPAMHRRRPSGDSPTASHSQGAHHSSSGSQGQGQHRDSAPSLRSSRSGYPSSQQQQQQSQQQHAPSPSPSFQRPVPVATSSWGRQPGFQNLSRPSSNRRQTMIT